MQMTSGPGQCVLFVIGVHSFCLHYVIPGPIGAGTNLCVKEREIEMETQMEVCYVHLMLQEVLTRLVACDLQAFKTELPRWRKPSRDCPTICMPNNHVSSFIILLYTVCYHITLYIITLHEHMLCQF